MHKAIKQSPIKTLYNELKAVHGVTFTTRHDGVKNVHTASIDGLELESSYYLGELIHRVGRQFKIDV